MCPLLPQPHTPTLLNCPLAAPGNIKLSDSAELAPYVGVSVCIIAREFAG